MCIFLIVFAGYEYQLFYAILLIGQIIVFARFIINKEFQIQIGIFLFFFIFSANYEIIEFACKSIYNCPSENAP